MDGTQRSCCLRRRESGEGIGEAFQAHGGVEVVVHPVLHHFKLHGTNSGQNRCLVSAQIGTQHLNDTLVLQLLNAATELLVLAGILGAGHLEVLRSEQWDGRVFHGFFHEQGVADAEGGSVH